MIPLPGVPLLCQKTAGELCALLGSGEITSTEIVSAYLQSIALQNRTLNAYLEVYEAEALSQAAASDARRRKGEPLSPLDGIPIAMKDNMMVQGHLCTCASRMMANFVSPYDATVALKLKKAGLPLLGRLNLDEFSMGGSTETGVFGSTRNPVNPAMVAGGSSGGAAAAVAAGMTPFALGSDTGGSLRNPASFCGVLGVKPAYGTVSRYGLVAFAGSLDQVGPIARTAQDAALLLNVIAGQDPRDATSDPSLLADFLSLILPSSTSLHGLHFGMPAEFFQEDDRTGLSAPVRHAIRLAVRRLIGMGAKVRTVSLPSLCYALSAYYVLSSVEAGSNLARFDGFRYGHRADGCGDSDALCRRTRQEGFGAEVKKRILFGAYGLTGGPCARPYEKARQVRALLLKETLQALADCDVLLMPVTSAAAYPLGAKDADPSVLYTDGLYTVPANLTGLPALSMPCGETDDGLPIGLGLMGARNSLPRLLAIASAYEQTHSVRQGGDRP